MVRMYQRAAARRGERCETLRRQEAPGGIRYALLAISGHGDPGWWALEAGVHRVQRVPPTERRGRRHTSAVTVAVLLPEGAAAPAHPEINPEDLEIETLRASGNGGQHINKTESAVRIRHRPTGITVTCQDERSQHQNRRRAMAILEERLHARYADERRSAYREAVRGQVGTGSRAEHQRTYNFIDGFVADSRTGKRTGQVQAVMGGRLDLLR